MWVSGKNLKSEPLRMHLQHSEAKKSVWTEHGHHQNNFGFFNVFSETHLKPDMPDASVNIPNYFIVRWDRNWTGNDKRSKGGVVICIRNNLCVVDVYRSDQYEMICVTIHLPSKRHRMLISAPYNPPKHNYQKCNLTSLFSWQHTGRRPKHCLCMQWWPKSPRFKWLTKHVRLDGFSRFPDQRCHVFR